MVRVSLSVGPGPAGNRQPGNGRSAHVGCSRRNGIIKYQGRPQIRCAKIDAGTAVISAHGVSKRTPRDHAVDTVCFGNRHVTPKGTTQQFQAQSVISAELLVVVTGSRFLVRRHGTAASLVGGNELVIHQSHHTVVVGQVFKIEFILERNQQIATAFEFNDDDTVKIDHPETVGVKHVGIADRLQPGILIHHQVIVIVEPVDHITQVIPDALGGDDPLTGVNRVAGRQGLSVRPQRAPADHGFNSGQVFIRNLAVGIGPDLVGGCGDLVAHGKIARLDLSGNTGRAGRGPDIIIQGQIIIGLDATGDAGVAGRFL